MHPLVQTATQEYMEKINFGNSIESDSSKWLISSVILLQLDCHKIIAIEQLYCIYSCCCFAGNTYGNGCMYAPGPNYTAF